MKLKEYFIFGWMFFVIALDTFIIALGYFGSMIEFLLYLTYSFLFYYLLFQLDNTDQMDFLNRSFILFLLICSTILITFILESNYPVLMYLRFILSDVLLILIGTKVFFTHLKSEIIYETKKYNLIKKSWLFIGLMLMLVGTIRGAAFTYKSILTISKQVPASLDHELIVTTEIIVTIAYVIFISTLLLMIFLAPEVLILTEIQLFKIRELYELINNQITGKSFFSTEETIHEYLKEISTYLDPQSESD